LDEIKGQVEGLSNRVSISQGTLNAASATAASQLAPLSEQVAAIKVDAEGMRERIETLAAEIASHSAAASASSKDIERLQQLATESRDVQQATEDALRELAAFAAELDERIEERLSTSGVTGTVDALRDEVTDLQTEIAAQKTSASLLAERAKGRDAAVAELNVRAAGATRFEDVVSLQLKSLAAEVERLAAMGAESRVLGDNHGVSPRTPSAVDTAAGDEARVAAVEAQLESVCRQVRTTGAQRFKFTAVSTGWSGLSVGDERQQIQWLSASRPTLNRQCTPHTL
jgi:chromosome segregation ATPase